MQPNYYYKAAVMLFLAIGASCTPLPAKSGILGKENLIYIQQGFIAPDKASAGIEATLDKAGGRTFTWGQLEKQIVHMAKLFEYPESSLTWSWPTRTWSVVVPFDLQPAALSENWQLALNQIGVNWAIYLNGRQIENNMFLDESGQISKGRVTYYRKILLPGKYLQTGRNVLLFHIAGYPHFGLTGFTNRNPFSIEPYTSLQVTDLRRITSNLNVLFLFFFLFHLMLYFRRSEDRHNLFFALFCLSSYTFLLASRPEDHSFFDDTLFRRRFELAFLYLSNLFFLVFFDSLLLRRISRFVLVLTGYYSFFTVTALFVPLPVHDAMLFVWQITTLVPLVYIVYRLVTVFKEDYHSWKAEYPEGALYNTLLHSVSGNLSIGLLVFLTMITYDILDAIFIRSGFRFFNVGFLIFNAGISIMISNQFMNMAVSIQRLNEDLNRHIDELGEAKDQVETSREKLRIITEGTSDVLLSLDSELKVVYSNRVAASEMKLPMSDIIDHKLTDLMRQDEATARDMPILLQKIQSVQPGGRPEQFSATMITGAPNEYRSFRFQLERYPGEGHEAFLVRGNRNDDDLLTEQFQAERAVYELGNYVTQADDLCQRLVARLPIFLDMGVVQLMRITLREILINAIEHGNLEITFDEKTTIQDEERYLEVLSEKRADPRLGKRKVRVEYTLNKDRVGYRVTDEGQGFDHRKLRREAAERSTSELLSHGRGIAMTESVFDTVRYNDRGNQVVLIKWFREEE